MRGGAKLLVCAAALSVAGCGGGQGELTIRATKGPLSAASQPVPERIAQARAQLAMGNAALALEAFRRALRDDPASVDATAGVAASYDLMGRFDLSRRYYEAALAMQPASTMILTALAASLTRQGRTDEAAAIRAEIRQRLAAVEAPSAPATQVPAPSFEPIAIAALDPNLSSAELSGGQLTDLPAASPVFEPDEVPKPALAAADGPTARPAAPTAAAVGQSITVKLPPPRPVATIALAEAPVTKPAPAPELPKAAEQAPTRARLERLSLGEVALVTTEQPRWRPTLVAANARTSTIRFVPLKQAARRTLPGIRLLNAARIQGLAARTRATLVGRGWRGMAIGNATTVRPKSLVLYPAASKAMAQRLAAQFGFALARRPSSRQVTVLLGRDAAALVGKRPAA